MTQRVLTASSLCGASPAQHEFRLIWFPGNLLKCKKLLNRNPGSQLCKEHVRAENKACVLWLSQRFVECNPVLPGNDMSVFVINNTHHLHANSHSSRDPGVV